MVGLSVARTWTAVLVALAALALTACGGDSGGSGSDTASIVPRSAFVYGEAVVDPEGSQEEAVHSIIGKFPGEGPPEQRIEKLVADALRESDEGEVDYEKDVKPWLGDKVSFFASAPDAGTKAGDLPAAAIVATDDGDKALDALRKAGGDDLKERTYKDVDYLLDAPDDGELQAGGIVEGFLVIGNEPAFKAVVDAASGESLSDSDRYKTATENVEEERIALFYSDIQGLISAIGQQQQSAAIPLAALSGPLQQLFGDKPIVATAKAENDGVVIDSRLSAQGGLLLSLFGKGTELVGELPADAWVAIGQPEVGRYLSQLVDSFAGLAGGREALAAQVRQATGLDLDKDILGWIGDIALFVQGTDMESIGGGVVIESTDEAASKRALESLARIVGQDATVKKVDNGFRVDDPETPAGVFFLQEGDRVVIAYGEEAANAALAGGGGLASNPTFQAATQKLGEGFETSLFVAMDRILEVARNFGAEEAELKKAEPYLSVFDSVVGGTKTDGDTLHSRVRVNLK